jgi:hypothetical protein
MRKEAAAGKGGGGGEIWLGWGLVFFAFFMRGGKKEKGKKERYRRG